MRRILDTPPTYEDSGGKFTNQYGITIKHCNTNFPYRDLVKKTQNRITGIKITKQLFFHDHMRDGIGLLNNGDEVYVREEVDPGIERHFKFTDDIANYPESIQKYMREHNFESIFHFTDDENGYDIGDYWVMLEDPGHSDYGEYTLCIETKSIYYVYSMYQFELRNELRKLRTQLQESKSSISAENLALFEAVIKQKEIEFNNTIPIGYAYYSDLIITKQN